MNVPPRRQRLKATLIWVAALLIAALPVAVAAASPLLAWRDSIYILGGFAGVAGLALMLFQPLLIAGDLPGISSQRSRQVHRVIGITLVVAVLVHVGALWITSPPDVIDVLLLRSPTPFAIWGVAAMWALFATALLLAVRARLSVPLRVWRVAHTALAVVVVIGTVVHAVLIEGTMGTASKVVLCAAVLLAVARAILDRKAWKGLRRARRGT